MGLQQDKYLILWGGAPGRISLLWLWCGKRTEVRSVPRVFTQRSEVPLVILTLCVMTWYNLEEGDLVSTSPPSFLRRATARLK